MAKFERMINPRNCFIKDFVDDMQFVFDQAVKQKRNVHILCEFEKKPRSTGEYSQNHHFNGHCQQIAQITGQPIEDVREYIKQMAISYGYPILTDNGNPVQDLWGNLRGISEADASSAECAILIRCVHQFADENEWKLREGFDEKFSY